MSLFSIFTRTIKISFYYSYKDERLRHKLDTHLSSLKQQNTVKIYWKCLSVVGRNSKQENYRYLKKSNVIVLLVSPDFMDSDDGWEIGTRAMKLYNAGKALVIPVKLRQIDHWEATPFRDLQPLPINGEPVDNKRVWMNQNQAFVHIAQGIREEVEKLSNSASTGILTSHRENRATIVPVVKVPVAAVVVIGVSVVVVVGSMLLIPQRHNLLETPLSEANPSPNSIQYVTPIGWIRIGLVNNTSNSLIFGDKLLQTTDPQIIDIPSVPSRNTIVTIKHNVDLRENKSLSSPVLGELQPGEKLKVFEVELLGESTNLPHRQVWAQVGRCNQICDK